MDKTVPCARSDARDVFEEAINRLAAIRGYCELAKLKGETGRALEKRMDAAIAAVDEVSALLRQVLADSCSGVTDL